MISSESVLIVGSSSTIGSSIKEILIRKGIPVWLTTRRLFEVNHQVSWLDLAMPSSSWQLPSVNPRAAVICAAVTSQKACEEDYAASYEINVSSTIELASRLLKHGVFVVFLSTNAVFDGTVPLVPADYPINPQSAYGQQKAAAEQALLALGYDSLAIVRLGKVLNRGFSLFQLWVDNLRANRQIHPFNDLYLAPISLQFATAVIARVIQQRHSGIIQASAKDDLSYAEVAYRLAANFDLDGSLVQPISCKAMGVKHAPRHTTLAADQLQALGFYSPDAGQVIDQFWRPIL